MTIGGVMSREYSPYSRNSRGETSQYGSSGDYRLPASYQGDRMRPVANNAPSMQQYPYTSQYVPRRASYDAVEPSGTPYGQGQGHRVSGGRRSNGIASRVLAAVVGLLLGIFGTLIVMHFQPDAPNPVSSTLAANRLDTVVGTYRYAGKVYEITAQDAIQASTGLDTMRNSDGSYDVPTADMVLSYARNQILKNLVIDNGITVTADEVSAYALEIVGSSDMAVVAQYFGMDTAQAQEIMTEAAAVRKLRQTVVGSVGSSPVPPALPADGNTEVGTAEYYSYIIGLLVGYWDSANGIWLDTNNAYYAALVDKVFAAGSASYEAAQAAYSVAYEQYATSSGLDDAWTTYLNAYLSEASISIATLCA